MCGRYYIDSDMADEIEKVVHDIDQRIRQEHFAGDIFPTNVAPIIEKSEHEKLSPVRRKVPVFKRMDRSIVMVLSILILSGEISLKLQL